MDKLSNKQETNPDIKTGNKKPLNFNNADINKFALTFVNTRNIYIPFKVPQSSRN